MSENLISLLRERRAGISPLRHSLGHSTEQAQRWQPSLGQASRPITTLG